MSFSLVNSSHGNSASPGNPDTITVTATTIGNVAVLAYQLGSGQTLTSVTNWTQIGSSVADTTNGQLYYIFYIKVTSSFTTITVNFNANPVATSFAYGELSSTLGFATPPLNVFNNGTLGTFTTGTDAVLSNNITPLATDLLVSSINSGDGNTPTFTAGTGWTIIATEPGSSTQTGATGLEFKASASGSSQHSTWTTSVAANGGAAGIASFSVPATTVTVPPPVVVDFAVTRASSY